MPFPDPGTFPISNKDVVSFTFDDPQYDIDTPVLIDPRDPSKYFSHRTAKDLVQRLIAGLHAAGLQKEETVCIHSFNSLVYPLLIHAIIGAGGRAVGTNPGYTRGELNHGVQLARVRFVFAEPEILKNMLDALKENHFDSGSRLFILDTEPDQQVPQGMKSWKSLLGHGTRDWERFDDERRSHDTAQLYYTSGTTGLPKCAMTTHRNLVAEHTLAYETNPRPYKFKIVLSMPFFHVGIAPNVIVSAIRGGREVYVMRRFELEPYLSYHSRYQLTEMIMVPPMVVAIVMSGLADPKSPNYDPKYSLSSVRNGTVGAAPCSGDMQRRLNLSLGPGATFGQVWGMTETTSIAALVPKEIASACALGKNNTWGNVGRPLPNITMKLTDEHGTDVTSTTGRGELCVKGPIVVKGYFENEAATNSSWDSEGFFKTGDVIQLDKTTGLMYVVERVKELIKVRGFQVAPAELEGALTEHPDIIDAAVIGVSAGNDEADELPRAYIVVRSGRSLSSEAVHAHMKDRVARYKQLTGGVHIVDSIPKSPSGKILKRVLRDEVKRDARKETPKL